ncbi:hypothetical protein ASPACDRAFT_61840 [Aspergillus aculeatus ATCC 16872]|uniref:Uncharacterized protein n=1 Tax=Aspergillus aculeatus (strain ATCC 16872 / CBS 172.66 / WB 5094) TaxID=690307 RepID=A0A1L9WQG5_ASPA1|nr:uncharacterized protein ASPACDRAFT_61840 [Aspergillus aculeatus ATCC 16872]OJJ98317.1 hypothetical protein ASPACDRAFT_61840 [Aspergillus aculeatus ATCC 16872]
MGPPVGPQAPREPGLPADEEIANFNLTEVYAALSKIESTDQYIVAWEAAAGKGPAANMRHREGRRLRYKLDDKRKVLRAAANELSRDQIRRLTILEMPAEVLLKAFEYFRHPGVEPGLVGWSWPELNTNEHSYQRERQNLCDARLVCRAFEACASPILFSFAAVSLSQASLDRFVALSRCPGLARALAADFNRFYGHRSRLEPYSHVAGMTMPEHRAAFHRAHEGYRRAHEEQHQLIASGDFVRTVAESVERMPNVITMGVTDRENTIMDYARYVEYEKEGQPEPAHLHTRLLDPLPWRHTEHPPARVLFELPVAVHATGCALQHVSLDSLRLVDAFPSTTGPNLGTPDSFSQLSAACQDLRSVSTGDPNEWWAGSRREILTFDRTAATKYLHALLSSRHVERVQIALRPMLGPDSQSFAHEFDVGPLVRRVQWPCLRELSLMCVVMEEEDLRELLVHLENSSLQRISLAYVHFRAGSWPDILDTWREAVRENRYRHPLRVTFNSPSEREKSYDFALTWQRAAMYVVGADGVFSNPFRLRNAWTKIDNAEDSG